MNKNYNEFTFLNQLLENNKIVVDLFIALLKENKDSLIWLSNEEKDELIRSVECIKTVEELNCFINNRCYRDKRFKEYIKKIALEFVKGNYNFGCMTKMSLSYLINNGKSFKSIYESILLYLSRNDYRK